MAKIGLTEGFKLIPEGSHVFKISKVDYKEEYGKMEVTLETVDGLKHIERFSLLRPDGETNPGAMNAFSYFAKVALNDFRLGLHYNDDIYALLYEFIVSLSECVNVPAADCAADVTEEPEKCWLSINKL